MEHYGYRAYEPEFPALARLLDSESGRRVQWNVGNEDLDTYINDFEPNNMAQVNAQMMVYFMLMHHQSPQSSYDVMETAAIGFGNNWDIVTLDAVHVYCGRNPVFAPFMGSRYNPAYTTLQSWNGASPPPNFGQPGGGSEPEPPPTELSSIIKYVQRVGNDLVIHAADGSISALYCGYMGNGNYLPRAN
jgi:hypothetical protein